MEFVPFAGEDGLQPLEFMGSTVKHTISIKKPPPLKMNSSTIFISGWQEDPLDQSERIGKSPKVEKVVIASANLKEFHVCKILSAPSLKSLDIRFCAFHPGDLFIGALGNSKVRELTMERCLAHEGIICDILRKTKVKRLVLGERISTEFATCIPNSNLTLLIINSYLDQEKAIQILAAATKCPSLTFLSLCCFIKSDKAIEAANAFLRKPGVSHFHIDMQDRAVPLIAEGVRVAYSLESFKLYPFPHSVLDEFIRVVGFPRRTIDFGQNASLYEPFKRWNESLGTERAKIMGILLSPKYFPRLGNLILPVDLIRKLASFLQG